MRHVRKQTISSFFTSIIISAPWSRISSVIRFPLSMPAVVSTCVTPLASTLSIHRRALLHEHLHFLQSVIATRILDSHQRQQHSRHSHGQRDNLIKSQAGEMFTVTAGRTAAACRRRTCRCRQEWRRLPWSCSPYFASVKPSPTRLMHHPIPVGPLPVAVAVATPFLARSTPHQVQSCVTAS